MVTTEVAAPLHHRGKGSTVESFHNVRLVGRGRRPTRSSTATVETLERRDCPTVVGIAGSRDVSEAVGSTAITFTLSAADKKPVMVDYRIEGSGTNARDFRLLNGTTGAAWPTGTVTFKPGEVSKTITVGIVNDTDREPSESIKVSLFKPRNATLGSANSATITILDDDSYAAQIVGAARVNEGQSGAYQLRLSSPATKTETFYVNTLPGSATQGIDYRPLTQLPLVFNKGETVKSFHINLLADAGLETDEFFFLSATPATTNFPQVAKASVVIAGTGPAPLPQLTISDETVIEGDAGPSSFTMNVSLSSVYAEPVTVRYATVDGSAKAATLDYQPVSGVVTIPAGETSALIVVNALGDTVQEPDEAFTVVISTPVNATIAKAIGTVTIIDNDTAFRIDMVFPDKTLTPTQQLAFRVAATRWSQIITADLPDVTINGRVIDDLEISATGPFIDGPNGILGQAGPRLMRTTGSQLPYTGVMRFDSADLAAMGANGTLTNVILHEMGHVLGIGTLWDTKNLLNITDPADPKYTGINGLREYRTLVGDPAATGVPVENTGGAGTADSHWRETVFKTELMTGYAERPGVSMPISRMTVGSLQDLGYTVNYAAADPYVLPAITSAGLVSSRSSAATGQRMRVLMSPTPVNLFAALGQASLEAVAAPQPKQRAFAGLVRS